MLSAVATLIQPTVDSQLVPVHARVQRMELFVYDQAKLALPESCRPLHCGLLRLSGGGATGWAEFEFSDGSAHLDLIKWGQVFRRLKYVEAAEARILIHQYESLWGFTRTHLAAEALTAWHKALSEGVSGAESGIEASSYMTGWTGLPTEREFLSYYCQSYYSF